MRLFWRVYLHGIGLVVAVALAIVAVGALLGRPGRMPHREASELAARASAVRGDPARLRAELERASELFGFEATVWSEGAVLASTVDPPLAEPRPGQLRHEGDRPVRLRGRPHTFAARLDGAPPAVLVLSGTPPFPWLRLGAAAAAVLVAVAFASIPLARAIASPVERLTGAMRRFGEGDLAVRARVAAPGEVGELSRAFDEMADRIERLLRAERELLANVSHELRTPLARIRVAVELAAEGDAERSRRMLGEIGADLTEVERLVGDVLTAARLDAGGGAFALRRERVAAEELVARSAERFEELHPGRRLALDIAPPLPHLDADPVLLRRALDNLLDNAAKYSDAEVALRARADAGSLTVTVSDQGIGVEPDDLPRLGTPFFRTARSRARGGGTGLGLALARRIAEAHGGTLALASAPGEGTAATLRIPAAALGGARRSPTA